MLTEIDEQKGLVKTYWPDIRHRVAKVEPAFAKLVDKLDPDKTFPVYLYYLPYGSPEGDHETTLLPKIDGGFYRLSDPNAPADVIKHLGYGKHSAPLGMVLDKCLELFIDLKDEGITIPWSMLTPGSFSPFSRILNNKSKRLYTPNGILSSTAGARSTFVLPSIGCQVNHSNLQRDFNIKSPPPKSLYEHWGIFKEILNSSIVNSDWRACIVYFSEKWVRKLHEDSAWLELKSYLHELAWQHFNYRRNHIYYDIVFSIIQKNRSLKPNPYLVDTARHLFTTALGATPGYVPESSDDALPLEIFQKAFVESYGLKKYFPTIMRPVHFSFEDDKKPVYYSLQHPSTYSFSPKSRKTFSTLFELRELEHIMNVFLDELSKEKGLCADTVIHQVAEGIDFDYFHNKQDRHNVIQGSKEIVELDDRFAYISDGLQTSDEAKFAGDSPFVRGCVRMRAREKR